MAYVLQEFEVEQDVFCRSQRNLDRFRKIKRLHSSKFNHFRMALVLLRSIQNGTLASGSRGCFAKYTYATTR